jgi:hypothetical protein
VGKTFVFSAIQAGWCFVTFFSLFSFQMWYFLVQHSTYG